MRVVLALTLLFAALAFAEAPANRFFNPETWTMGSMSNDEAQLTFNIFLTQHNLEALNAEFHRLTTPGSPEWRHWKTMDEVKAITAPPAYQKVQVRRWLASAGITEIVDRHDAYKVTASIRSVSKLLDTTFFEFTHLASGSVVSRQVGEYTIPADLQDIIQFLTGVTEFPFAARRLSQKKSGSQENSEFKVVPYVIDQLYNIPYEDKTQVNKRASVGVVEYQGDNSFSQSDLSTFQEQNNLIKQEVPQSQIIGPYSPTYPDAEATLDIEYAWGVSYNTSAWYWTVEGWLLDWCVDFQTTSVTPSVVSMSWGWTEDNQCQIANCDSSKGYVDRVNSEFQAISLTGVTITASSGDQGAPGDGDTNCRNNQQPLSSIFPGASPFVLSIGATMLVSSTSTEAHRNHYDSAAAQPVPPICQTETCADPSQMEEVACSYPEALITTGGGFSAYSPRPSWQNAVVTQYLNSVPPADLPPALDFNATNRGFPDVSALGHNYLIRRDNSWELVDGTSCSAPVWAGLISLWNDFEARNGRPVLGFINPLLYQAYASDASMFFDIVNGNNKCSESECCEYGYSTLAGWDPVTGLGSPDFSKLYTYIQSQSSTFFRK